MRKSGCVSCHNNTLTYMTLATAHEKGIAVNDQIVAKELKTITSYLESWRERVLQGVGIPGDSDTISAILVGLADARVPPDPATDALANYLQKPSSARRAMVHRRAPAAARIERKEKISMATKAQPAFERDPVKLDSKHYKVEFRERPRADCSHPLRWPREVRNAPTPAWRRNFPD